LKSGFPGPKSPRNLDACGEQTTQTMRSFELHRSDTPPGGACGPDPNTRVIVFSLHLSRSRVLAGCPPDARPVRRSPGGAAFRPRGNAFAEARRHFVLSRGVRCWMAPLVDGRLVQVPSIGDQLTWPTKDWPTKPPACGRWPSIEGRRNGGPEGPPVKLRRALDRLWPTPHRRCVMGGGGGVSFAWGSQTSRDHAEAMSANQSLA